MIGQLTGTLISKEPPELLLDVHGVGYEILASMQTFYELPELGSKLSLHTHFVVREDAQLLYGFSKIEERTLFRALIKVNGVGPQLALRILSSIRVKDFIYCIEHKDYNSLTKVPGIGKKTAERLVIEMGDKLPWDWQSFKNLGSVANSNVIHPDFVTVEKLEINGEALDPIARAQHEAVAALITLGYKPQEAKRAVQAVNKHENMSAEQLIRDALKEQITA